MKDLNKKLERFKIQNKMKEKTIDTSYMIRGMTNEIKPVQKMNYTNELKRGIIYKGRKITRL